MHAIIFTGGKLRPSKLVRKALASADMVIAADSGAEAALEFKTLPSVVIGDFDSLGAAAQDELKERGVTFIVHDSAKDQTDTELAVEYAVNNHASRITILGGIEGDRLDHVLANIFSVMSAKLRVQFISGMTTAWVLRGPATSHMTGSADDTVSLIPLTSRASGITTSGLRYPLRGETLHMGRARGVSNVMIRAKASVTLSRGALLLVHNAGPE